MRADDGERPVDFDAWLTSRSAALTRFAYLLAGSEPAAEAALASALAVACSTWSRVRRSDDPEAHVRRLVVEAYLAESRRRGERRRPALAVPTQRSEAPPEEDDAARAWRICAVLPPAQRAALVLRCYAEMTYPQIAAVVGGKEAAARAQVDGAFAALRLAVDGRRSDDEIEAAFGEAFTEHAEDPVDPGDRAASAYASARRRRRRRIVPAVAASTLLVAAALGGVAAFDAGDHDTAAKPAAGDHPRGWRAESYSGIQLWVPSAWGWGQAPRTGGRGVMSCGLSAYSPNSIDTGTIHFLRGAGALPYVGRPEQPDAGCAAPRATAPHVWFDSPLPPGSGRGQTTVAVHGVTDFTITVADANRVERSLILRSIEHVTVDAHGCPRDAPGIGRVEAVAGIAPDPATVRTLSLCVFAATPTGEQVLFYSTMIDGGDAQQAAAQIEAIPAHRDDAVCLVTPALGRVVLIARTSAAPGVFGVNPGRCPDPVGYVTGSSFHVLTEATLRLWAIDAMSLYAGVGGASGAGPTGVAGGVAWTGPPSR